MNNFKSKKLLFLYPTSGLTPTIPGALPVLAGIAKERGWAFRLFDTFRYDKQGEDTNCNRESSGEFKRSDCFSDITRQPFSSLVTDLQAEIDAFQPDLIAITCMSVDFSFLVTFFPQLALPAETLVVGGVSTRFSAPRRWPPAACLIWFASARGKRFSPNFWIGWNMTNRSTT